MNRSQYIALFRKHGFNAFPIPRFPKTESQQKRADKRYDSRRTKANQPINDNENWGYLPVSGKGNAIIDLDHETYQNKALEFAEKFMVIQTANGRWHIPVVGLSDDSSKIELFDKSIQEKKIIEIQGIDHYCIGLGSKIYNNAGELAEYVNIGTDTFFDAKSDFHHFVDQLSQIFQVSGIKKTENQNYQMRQRFKSGKIPSIGTSNDFYFNAALQCNTDGLSKNEAIEKIRENYDKWTLSNHFSHRPWSNIEAKIDDVYDNERKITKGRKEKVKTFDRTLVAQQLINNRKFYSDISKKTIFENKNGFLEEANDSLQRELQREFPEMERTDIAEIFSKIMNLSDPIPERNKDLIVFDNGIMSRSKKKFVKTDDIAYLGFRGFNYIANARPKKFCQIMFDNYPKNEHQRIKAALKSILNPYYDVKLTVLYGLPRVGKSTAISILVKLLGQYAMSVELHKLLTDPFTRSSLEGKLLVNIQEMPPLWKNLELLKLILGENTLGQRGLHAEHRQFQNTIKAFASGNNLPPIPSSEESYIFTRLSLCHNTRVEKYKEDPTLEDRIIKEEGSEILSYILDLTDDYQYEPEDETKAAWYSISSPEIQFIENNFQWSLDGERISLYEIMKEFRDTTGKKISKTVMKTAIEDAGFTVERLDWIEHISRKTESKKRGQQTL